MNILSLLLATERERERADIFLKNHDVMLDKFLSKTHITLLGVRFVKLLCLTRNFEFKMPTDSSLVKTIPKTSLITNCNEVIVEET